MNAHGQDDDLEYETSPWAWNSSISGTVTHVSYSNWAAGGEDYSYALGLNARLSPSWSDGEWSFESEFDGRFTVFRGKGTEPKKIQDRLEWSAKGGYRLTDDFHAIGFYDLQTQFWPGYGYAYEGSEGSYISNVMAPGFLTGGIAVDYRNDSLGLSIAVTPFAFKSTFVLDNGVDPDNYGVAVGKKIAAASGSYAHLSFSQTFLEKISVRIASILFIDYTRKSELDISLISEVDYELFRGIALYAETQLLRDNDMKEDLYEDLDGDGSSDDFAGVASRLQVFTQFGLKFQVRF